MNKERKLVENASGSQGFAKFALFFIFSMLIFATVFSIGFINQYPKAAENSLGAIQACFAVAFGGKNIPAGNYYTLGLAYKGKGWVETSRQAMAKAREADPQSLYAHSSDVFVKVALPRIPISKEAEEGNIEAYNLMSGDGAIAAKAFRDLIEKYPKFEWPMGNLASMYLDENNLGEAEKLINAALEINPDYLNGLRYKATLKLKQGNTAAARAAYQQALDALGPPETLEPTLSSLREEILEQQERLKLAKQ